MTNQLTLKWTEAGVAQTQTIQNGQPSKNPGTVRIGSDQTKCDLVLSHPSVSGLHVEIFFNQELQEFRLRNLRQSNLPVVDGKILASTEAKLSEGMVQDVNYPDILDFFRQSYENTFIVD